mgnify:FL=1|tara:strand:- start:611 stop:1114 length:504 start_codon:yes stop_codon:yes gene_type:complete
MTGEKENKPPAGNILSTAQEDYIETIFNLSGELDKVRVTDIAERLGVRMPAVTRAVQGLEKLRMIERGDGRGICLTPLARKLAGALVHRHSDLVTFLTEVLGVDERIAEADTCQMEHGISAETAQSLHEFLKEYARLDEKTREQLRSSRTESEFRFLPDGKGSGWRA